MPPPITVKPRYNEGLRDWQNLFAVTRFWYINQLHGGVGSQVGEVTHGGSTNLSCKHNQIKMKDYMDRRLTSPTWGSPPPYKQALKDSIK